MLVTVVPEFVTTSSFALVKFQRNPAAHTTGNLLGAKEIHGAAKIGTKVMRVKAMFGSFKTGGVGVLERPIFDQSQFDPSTQVFEGGDIDNSTERKDTDNRDNYRVLLVDDSLH
ncbi:hypothetical protein HRI_004508000 [Hibiscus trionum]|uniref:Uncharacterized protein n=1 Tax=Hibiscus trionum TaxID=183268 RepID=A0A9W7J589_HIBTR|nr:hypothetical protein HRI_004508000 [Hibiscus trionum]